MNKPCHWARFERVFWRDAAWTVSRSCAVDEVGAHSIYCPCSPLRRSRYLSRTIHWIHHANRINWAWWNGATPTVLHTNQYLYFKSSVMRQTLHVVLDWCSSQQKSVTTLEAKKGFPPSTGRVLDVLSFIENHILPLDALEVLLVLRDLLHPA